jgi:hypothetical protein
MKSGEVNASKFTTPLITAMAQMTHRELTTDPVVPPRIDACLKTLNKFQFHMFKQRVPVIGAESTDNLVFR